MHCPEGRNVSGQIVRDRGNGIHSEPRNDAKHGHLTELKRYDFDRLELFHELCATEYHKVMSDGRLFHKVGPIHKNA